MLSEFLHIVQTMPELNTACIAYVFVTFQTAYIVTACCNLQVLASVQKGILDMAKQNLEQEQLISEVKNHIAIVRLACISETGHANFVSKKACHGVEILPV